MVANFTSSWHRVLVVAIALLLLSGGCRRSDAIVRLPIRGTVARVNGDRVNGAISFIPAEGHHGPAATATLKNGNYAFDATNGPTAGPHRVIVNNVPAKDTLVAGKREKRPSESGRSNAPTQWTFYVTLPTNRSDRCDFTVEP